MEIRKLKAYRVVSVLSLILGLLAVQGFFPDIRLQMIGIVTGVIGTFLIGLAAITTQVRFVVTLLRSKQLKLFSRSIGISLAILPSLLWYFSIAKFAIVPVLNDPELGDHFIPSVLAVVNGTIGILLFVVVVQFMDKLLNRALS
ncbi:hypothetical protein [Enterovibrio norvegicus]|uniref:hypothetical protein n=1 Tax=Enterovibrio norvegicus TaxID=188144 RepID=UPI0024B11782|nr:hypothetical protein [Enterovibrio norvegicus]